MKNKKSVKITICVIIILGLFWVVLPTYLRQALMHWNPDITDAEIFSSHVVAKAEQGWDFPFAIDFNQDTMTLDEEAYFKKYGTVAYLVSNGIVFCMKNIERGGMLRNW